jgi:class 3 adenylate cyclase
LSIAATGLIAVAFQPARDRSRRLANRLVYGRRATPYEVLSAFSRGVTGASTDDSLQRMARLVVEATGAVQATVWLRLGEVLQPQARWPQRGPLPEPVALEGRGTEEALAATQATSLSFPVGHEEELLGALTVTVSPAEPLTPASEKLITDLATQTGLGLRFQRMKERALFARALASFLPPEVAELVEASPSALSLREELEATILFSDIRGFSSLAERLPPRQVAEVVGRHLAAMVEVVTAHGGVLDKFAGDAVMAVFGAPRPAADHARRALACAAAMQRRQLTLNAEAEQAGLPAFQIGIGVNTGTVIAGTLGGPGRLDYTVLGDAVNVAQRLQSEAVGGEILAAAVTVLQAGVDRAEPVGRKRLKGRQELVEVYRVHWAATPAAQPWGAGWSRPPARARTACDACSASRTTRPTSKATSSPWRLRIRPSTITVSTLAGVTDRTMVDSRSTTGATLRSSARIMMRSARLPGVIEPVTCSSPSARAPSMVAISMHRRKVSASRSLVSLSCQGMPMFQATFMASNRLTGARDAASIDRVTRTPAASIRSSAALGSPASPSRSSEWTAKLSGVPVRAIAWRSASVAARKWQIRNDGPR